MGFSKQECWSGLPCPPPGDLPQPGLKFRSPTLQADSLLPEPPGNPLLALGPHHFFCCAWRACWVVWVRCREAGREDRGWSWSIDEGQPWARTSSEPADGPADGHSPEGLGAGPAQGSLGHRLRPLLAVARVSRWLSWPLLLPAVVGPSQTAAGCAQLGA